MMKSNSIKIVNERWKTINTQIMRAINPAFEEKIFQQTHAELGPLEEEFSQNWTFGQLHYTGTPKSNYAAKHGRKIQNVLYQNNSGRHINYKY